MFYKAEWVYDNIIGPMVCTFVSVLFHGVNAAYAAFAVESQQSWMSGEGGGIVAYVVLYLLGKYLIKKCCCFVVECC